MDRCGVINAGPLIALSLAGRLDLLPRLFAEYWIPDVVWREVTGAGIWRPGAVALTDSVYQRHVREAPEPDPLLLAELDHGEAAVISLARECRPCTVIIDERRGRRIAGQVYGLPVRGTAGLLVAACRQGWLTDLREVLMALRRDGYYLSDAVIEAACRALDGS